MPADSGGGAPRVALERNARDAQWDRKLEHSPTPQRGDDAELRRRELVITLRQARHVLSERERFVLHLRFSEDRTQTEIAQRIGVSQMQVSRILRAVLDKLRLELRRQGVRRAA